MNRNKVSGRPFELEHGTWVAHDISLSPPHVRIHWDRRCDACVQAKAFVQGLKIHTNGSVPPSLHHGTARTQRRYELV